MTQCRRRQEIGDAEAAVLRGSIAPSSARGAGRVGCGGRQVQAARGASPSRTRSFGTPTGTLAAKAYRPPRPARDSVARGGGRQAGHLGAVDEASADNGDANSEHTAVRVDYSDSCI